MENKKDYFYNIDQLKGLAILLMVMAHVLAWSYTDYSFLKGALIDMTKEEFNASLIWKIIYSFHMPLLFFASGYLFYKVRPYDWINVKQLLLKRINRLLIPYLTTGVFVLFLKGYFGYWFFQVLFVLNVIVLLELFIESKIRVNIFGECACHIFVFLILFIISKCLSGFFSLPQEFANITGLHNYYLAFMFGFLVHKWPCIERLIQCHSIGLGLFFLYILLMTLASYYGIKGIYCMLIPILAISFLFGIFNNRINKGGLLSTIGKNSMEIYIMHLFFVMPFKEMGIYILSIKDFSLSITLQLVYSAFISIISIKLSILVSNVIKRNKYLSQLIFGIYKYDQKIYSQKY